MLDAGYKHKKQIYNVTKAGIIVKFQPDGSPQNGYHSYQISNQKDIPTVVMKEFLRRGIISKKDFRKYLKGSL